MSLRVQQLNADTTFLLTFSPPFAPARTPKRFPGDFVILIDPWLRGYSSILHPTFQISHHTSTPALHSLTDLNHDPDLIIISQDKPDHCHKETLCSLPKGSKTNILATPAAGKKIRSWKHFDARKVHIMKAYNPADPDSVARITLPAYSSASAAGEITIANVPSKRDMTGLHNVIGITYQPPSTVLTLSTQHNRYAEGSTVKLSADGITRPPTAPAPASPTTPRARARTASSAAQPPFLDGPEKASNDTDLPTPPPIPQDSPPREGRRQRSLSRVRSLTKMRSLSRLRRPNTAQTDSNAPASRTSSSSFQSTRNAEKPLSVLYTPHGVSSHLLTPYITHHLEPLNCLPVSALFHSFNVEENPWFMGGVVAAGAPGGLELVKRTGAAHWIAAHDEKKDNRGVATVWIKSRPYEVEEVEEMLFRAGRKGTKVHRLAVGDWVRVPELKERDERRGRTNGTAHKPAMPMMNGDVHSRPTTMDTQNNGVPPLPPAPMLNGYINGRPTTMETNTNSKAPPPLRPQTAPGTGAGTTNEDITREYLSALQGLKNS